MFSFFFSLLLNSNIFAQTQPDQESSIKHKFIKNTLINLSIHPGLNFSSLSASSSFFYQNSVDFDNELALRLDLELEAILPFNNYRWGIFAAGSIQYFKSEKELQTSIANTEITFIEIPIGIRHYLPLNPNSKLFLNAAFVIDADIFSVINYDNAPTVSLIPSNIFAIGIGYKSKDKISVEYRYYGERYLSGSYLLWDSEFTNMSLIFGFKLF